MDHIQAQLNKYLYHIFIRYISY